MKPMFWFLVVVSWLSELIYAEDPFVPAYEATNYAGGSATTEFCRSTAFQYCAKSSMPEYCMQKSYLDTGYCKQIGGEPNLGCRKVKGLREEYDFFCQTSACEYAFKHCMKEFDCAEDCWESIGEYVDKFHSSYCKGASAVRVPGQVGINKRRGSCSGNTTTTPAPSSNECWASNGGWSGKCEKCPEDSVQQNQCTVWSWYPCQKSYKACNAHKSDMTTCLTASCKKNSKEAQIKRPSFSGPNCYDSKYGAQFGPEWTPTGKTAFEKYFPDMTEFYQWILLEGSGKNPNLNEQWGGLKECQATIGIYENIVCAIELLQAKNKPFEAAPDGTPGHIEEFMASGDEKIDKLEIAAMFAHFQKETGRLVQFVEKQTVAYTVESDVYPAVPGKKYLGRGPFQLSYNTNYGRFSEYFFDDKHVLLNDPDKVDPEGPMGMVAALWFWFTPLEWAHAFPITGKLRPRDAVVHWFDSKLTGMYQDPKYDEYAGFGITINIINSDECTEAVNQYGNAPWRVYYFLAMANRLGLALDLERADCQAQKSCYGITKGCTGAHGKYVCSPDDLGCGVQYSQGSTPFCKVEPLK